MIEPNLLGLSVGKQCALLSISRSSFYYMPKGETAMNLMLMRLIDVFRGMEVMLIMTGGGPGRSTELLSLHIYNRAFETQQLGYASAISVLLIAIVFGISTLILTMANPMKSKADV